MRSGALPWLGQVLVWVVLLFVTGLVVVGVLLPRAVGGTPYAVLTGSMAPALPVGTLAVTRPVDIDEVMVGEVVTYQLSSGESTVVTHRVIGTRINAAGERELLTQGDTNAVTDREPVREVQLRGRLWYAVPHLGRVSALLSNDQRQLAIYGLGGALALYSVGQLTGAARDRRRRRPVVPAHRADDRTPQNA